MTGAIAGEVIGSVHEAEATKSRRFRPAAEGARMWARKLSYRCDVCGWQGMLKPIDVGNAAPCSRCGVYLYPLSWAQTWGVALSLIGLTLAVVLAAVTLLK